MKNRVPEVFLSEMFGELRIMEDDNKFYFCAADVCSALGYSNPSHPERQIKTRRCRLPERSPLQLGNLA